MICKKEKEEKDMIREHDVCIACVTKIVTYIFTKGLTFVPSNPAYFLLRKDDDHVK